MSQDERIAEALEELVKWMKVTSIPKVKTILLETLSKPEEKIAYECSDGSTSRQIAGIVGVHPTTISSWWKKWAKLGIAEYVTASGGQRGKKVFSLEDFDIEVPPIKSTASQENREVSNGNESARK